MESRSNPSPAPTVLVVVVSKMTPRSKVTLSDKLSETSLTALSVDFHSPIVNSLLRLNSKSGATVGVFTGGRLIY